MSLWNGCRTKENLKKFLLFLKHKNGDHTYKPSRPTHKWCPSSLASPFIQFLKLNPSCCPNISFNVVDPAWVNVTISKYHDREQKYQEIVQPYLVVAAVHHLLQGVNLYQAALKNKYQEEKISSINTSIPMLSNFHCLMSDCIFHRFSEF